MWATVAMIGAEECLLAEVVQHYYRGTTPGWPGNPILQQERLTCTTTDPLVATLFAIECLHHGPGIVLIAPREIFKGLIGPNNHAALWESEVVLTVSPLEFAAHALRSIEAIIARDILVEMGFNQLPIRISDKSTLREAIHQTYVDAYRLNEMQIEFFNRRTMESAP